MYKFLRDKALYFCITLAFFIFLYSIYFNDSLTLRRERTISPDILQYIGNISLANCTSLRYRYLGENFCAFSGEKKNPCEVRKRRGGGRRAREGGRRREPQERVHEADRTGCTWCAGASIVGGKREFALSHPRIYPTPSSQGAGLRYHPCRPRYTQALCF